MPVELSSIPALGLELLESLFSPCPQLVDLPELDRVGRARLRAGGLVPAFEPVVAERAFPDPAVLLLPEDRQVQGRLLGRPRRQLTLVEDAERTGWDAVAAAVADVLLHHDRPVLGAEERSGRADVEAGRMRAVLADVGAHQPAKSVVGTRIDPRLVAVEAQRRALLDEGDVAPRVRSQLGGVVVGLAAPEQPVLRNQIPFLAGDLAGLAADADRRVGEEAHARLRLLAVRVRPRGGRPGDLGHAHVGRPSSRSTRGAWRRSSYACSRWPATNWVSLSPRGRRPGRMSQESAFTSWMCTLGSSAMCVRSFAAPPV